MTVFQKITNNTITGSFDGTFAGGVTITGTNIVQLNNTKIVDVSSPSDIPATLEDNTTYVIRGTVTIPSGSEITTSTNSAIIGLHRDKDKLVYTGPGNFITVLDNTVLLKDLGLSTTNVSSCVITASNVSSSGYNDSRDEMISIINCQFRNVKGNLIDLQGFDLVDISNSTFFYCESPIFGCRFQDVSKLEISSCEFIRWFDETSLPSPSGYYTAKMIELAENNLSSFGAVNISGCIIHPQQTQYGLYINSGSTTGFGTVASNAFVDTGITTGGLLGGSTYDSSSMLAFDVGLNRGISDSNSFSYGYQVGTDSQAASTTYTQIQISNFVTQASTRMSASSLGISYVGAKPLNISMNISAGLVVGGGNNQQFDIALYKNTTLVSGSVRRIELDTSEEGIIDSFALINVVQNDLLTVYYKSPTNDGFTLQNFTIKIKE